MPPRHAYWTILVDNQPTAFRAHEAEELLPTLNRLKEKHASAVMMWFERGRLWVSRDAAREEADGRRERPGGDTPGRREHREHRERNDRVAAGGERPRDRNWRPGGEHRDPRQKFKDAKKAKWQRFKQQIRDRQEARHGEGRPAADLPPAHGSDERTPHGRTPQERPHADRRETRRPDWKPQGGESQRGWRPKGPAKNRPAPGDWKERPRDGGWQDRDRSSEGRPRPPYRDDRNRAGGGWRPNGPDRRDDRPRGNWRDQDPRDRGPRGYDHRDRDDRRSGDRREDHRREDDRRGPPGRTGDRRPWGTKPGAPAGGSGRKPWGTKPGGPKGAGTRKPWGTRPPGSQAARKKPFGKKPLAGGRGPGRPGAPGRRGPRKPRDDE